MTTLSTASAAVSSDRLTGAAAYLGWRLDARRAMTLLPLMPSRLQITQGRAWVTLGVPHRGVGDGWGDHVLEAGDSMVVPAGARLVMEPWAPATDGQVRFDWMVEPFVAQGVEQPDRFGREVAAPSRELAVALAQAGGALVRLVRGVLGYSEYLLAGRGRTLVSTDGARH